MLFNTLRVVPDEKNMGVWKAQHYRVCWDGMIGVVYINTSVCAFWKKCSSVHDFLFYVVRPYVGCLGIKTVKIN